jgi:hypothetical protein
MKNINHDILIEVTYPFEETTFIIQRDNRVCSDAELPQSALRLLLQELVDERVELHHATVLAQIVFGLAQKHIRSLVASLDGDLPWLLKRWQDRDLVFKPAYRRKVARKGVVIMGVLVAIAWRHRQHGACDRDDHIELFHAKERSMIIIASDHETKKKEIRNHDWNKLSLRH